MMGKIDIIHLSERREILAQVADLHSTQIPSFRASLGRNHLLYIYEQILDHKLGDIFVALHEGRLVGFISTVEDLKTLNKMSQKNMRWTRFFESILRHPVFILDIIDHLLYLRSIDKKRNMYLASLAVDDSASGPLAAVLLLQKAKRISKERGKHLNGLVWKKNKRALKFYQAGGFEILRTYTNVHWIGYKGAPNGKLSCE